MRELSHPAMANEREKCDNDSVLLLRQLYITWLAKQAGTLEDYFLEHPEDPKDCNWAPVAAVCASFWTTMAYNLWAYDVSAELTKFDQ